MDYSAIANRPTPNRNGVHNLNGANYNEAEDNQTLSIQQWIFFVSFFASSLMLEAIGRLPGPIFPQKAEEKGLSISVYGAIMGMSGFARTFAIFIGITNLDRICIRKVYLLSVFIDGLCPTVFGLLDHINSKHMFAGLAFAIRGTEGVSNIGVQYAIYATCAAMFPKKFGTAISIPETGFLVGGVLGPFVGSTVVPHLGFMWTFIAFGIVQMGIALLSFVYLPPVPKYEFIDVPLKDVLKRYKEMFSVPDILFSILVLTLVEVGTDFVSTILEPGLREHHFTHYHIGLMFLCLGVLNVLSPVWGVVLDHIPMPEVVVGISYLLLCISLMFLGPLPFVPIHRAYTSIVFALLLFGFGQGMLNVSAAVNFKLELGNGGFTDNDSVVRTFLPVVYVASAGIGALIGSSSAGILFDHFEFSHALLFLFTCDFTMSCFIFSRLVSKKCRSSRRRSKEYLLDEEKKPLTSSK